MKKALFFIALSMVVLTGFAQKKKTTSATISFDATTSLDKLPKADNKTVIASLDTKKGTLAFEAIIKNFSFSNPKMQEHFNSPNWMDSDKYPNATFKGKLTNLSTINFKKDGTYPAELEGELNLHGKTQQLKTTGSVTVKGKVVSASADFTLKLEDYGVNGPAIGAGKVSKDPKVSVTAELK